MTAEATEQSALDELLAVLDVRQTATDSFTGPNQPVPTQRLFGGQLLGQALVACGRTVPPALTIRSLHAYFLRPGDPLVPVHYTVHRFRSDGPSTIRHAEATQDGTVVFSAFAAFHETTHLPTTSTTCPKPAAPTEGPSEFPFHTGPTARPGQPIELRAATSGATGVWLRPTARLPDDPLLHHALLAHLSDISLLRAAVREHRRETGTAQGDAASLDHAMWFHGVPRLRDWLWYATTNPSAHGSRGLGLGRMIDQSGTLLATVGQEGLFRPRRQAR
ncbi:acyl-CoA thioesterase-2 [Tamaricihabitans halophyticus]|uniref:Acyl-CoA thioesterase-2 n=1 Tax=Tamaricihabitans halophyticus TaxID=1262583 RepID=A0A4R2QCP4_9PSEU|nr:acyl-CoA thioesterase domain-containing protein [Tamaricihabitans halophyticus]TCP46812.1 acyl-CoA thioesterase-2 [Tamaricihabitans halophyticus]